jgi:hypothetical protein
MSASPTYHSLWVANRRLEAIVDAAIRMHAILETPHGWACWTIDRCPYVAAIRAARPDAQPVDADAPGPPRELL